MIDVSKSVVSFKKLSRDEKIKKIKSLLDIVREDGNIFDDIHKLLEIDDQVREEILDIIYESLINAMYTLQVEEMERQIEKMEKIKEKMKDNQKIELQEKEEADKILENLL